MFCIALGQTLEQIKWKIGASLYKLLQANLAELNPKKATNVIREQFNVDVNEIVEDESRSVVFGSSLVHFPRSLRTRLHYRPVSSSFR